ncbi:MAG: S9 family peptidase, partial [Bryobacteraceae bacterium]
MFRALIILSATLLVAQAQKMPFEANALLKLARISDPQISPDGQTVAFSVQRVDLEKNTRVTQIYIVPATGGIPRQLTTEGTLNERARWSPDAKKIAWISNRGGTSQVWLMDADGTHAQRVTGISTEAEGVVFSHNGKQLFFTSEVYPDCPDDACNKQKLAAGDASKVKAREYTSLLYRHWTKWQSARRKHILVVDVEGGVPKDLTPGGYDVPPFSLGGP